MANFKILVGDVIVYKTFDYEHAFKKFEAEEKRSLSPEDDERYLKEIVLKNDVGVTVRKRIPIFSLSRKELEWLRARVQSLLGWIDTVPLETVCRSVGTVKLDEGEETKVLHWQEGDLEILFNPPNYISIER